MNQESIRNNKTRSLQIALVVGLIVAFPIISVIINFKGAENGRAFYKGIKNNLGTLPTFSSIGWNNDTLTSANLKGKVLIVSFASDSSREEVMNTLKPIVKTEQLREEIDNLNYLTFDLTNDSIFNKNYLQNLNTRDRELWHILRGGNELPAQMKLSSNYIVSLVDTAGVIRRFYDVRNPIDKKLLVEHISIMPIRKKVNVEKKDQKSL